VSPTNTSARGIWIANLALIPRRWTRCLALLVIYLKLCGVARPYWLSDFERQPHRDLWCNGGVVGKATRYGLAVTELNVGGGLEFQYTEFGSEEVGERHL